MYKRLILFLILVISSLQAADMKILEQKTKKYNLSVCAIFKNEAKYLREWIEYHRLVGIDHFYLYNNNSDDHFRRILVPYVKQSLVTLIDWPDLLKSYTEDQAFMWALSTQVSAYENAIKVKAAHETEWLVFLDVNEFLVPGDQLAFAEILKKYEAYSGITFSIDAFNASAMIEVLPQKLVIETMQLTHDAERNPQKEVVKTIFKPSECTAFRWPPYQCVFKESRTSVRVNKNELRINRYAHRCDGSLFYRKVKQKVDVDSRKLSECQLASLLEAGFEVEDRERAIQRYVPELFKKLGLDTGWNTMEGKENENSAFFLSVCMCNSVC